METIFGWMSLLRCGQWKAGVFLRQKHLAERINSDQARLAPERHVALKEAITMRFLMTGFEQANEVRQYAFIGIAADRSRRSFTVGADLSRARKHQITLQELPLLCCRLLEKLGEDATACSWTVSEADMLAYTHGRRIDQEAALGRSKSHASSHSVADEAQDTVSSVFVASDDRTPLLGGR